MEPQTMEQQTEEEQSEEPQPEVWYAIDPEWYAQRGVDLAHTVRRRRCADCAESGFPPKGTAKRRSRKDATNADLFWDVEMQSIGACCSAKAGYLTTETSILEAVFRLLLRNGNQPLSVQEFYEGFGIIYGGFNLKRLALPSDGDLQRLGAVQPIELNWVRPRTGLGK